MSGKFGGGTYDAKRDGVRLNAQQARVFNLMRDGAWRTLDEIAAETNDPQASISARLRDFRKPHFGGHAVNRQCVFVEDGKFDGLHEYQLKVKQ